MQIVLFSKIIHTTYIHLYNIKENNLFPKVDIKNNIPIKRNNSSHQINEQFKNIKNKKKIISNIKIAITRLFFEVESLFNH